MEIFPFYVLKTTYKITGPDAYCTGFELQQFLSRY